MLFKKPSGNAGTRLGSLRDKCMYFLIQVDLLLLDATSTGGMVPPIKGNNTTGKKI
jgi:hypothetical protein